MFELFNQNRIVGPSSFISPVLKYAFSELEGTISKVNQKYYESQEFVANEHVLIKLLKTMPQPQTDDPRRWYYQAQDLADGIFGLHGIIDSRNYKADVAQNLFLGNVGEILIATSTNLGSNLSVNDWLAKEAITVISHPYTDYRARPLDAKFFPPAVMGDHAVIGIDLPLMYVQYYLWLSKVVPVRYPDGSHPTMHNWMYMFPLNQATRSYRAYASFNRYVCLATGVIPTAANVQAKVPYQYVDYTAKIDEGYFAQVKFLEQKQLDYAQILNNIPTLHSTNALELLKLKSSFMNRQVRWCYLAARIDAMSYLYHSAFKIKGSDRIHDEKWRYGLKSALSEYSNDWPSTPKLMVKIKTLASEL